MVKSFKISSFFGTDTKYLLILSYKVKSEENQVTKNSSVALKIYSVYKIQCTKSLHFVFHRYNFKNSMLVMVHGFIYAFQILVIQNF